MVNDWTTEQPLRSLSRRVHPSEFDYLTNSSRSYNFPASTLQGMPERRTDVSEIEALLGLLYLAGVYHGSGVNVEEFWRMDGM
ncbi:hypothetical protein NPIL_189971 [Nephila pilipes]|uniref:PiggyBac transposable element-derived protein domain-containing protein n=1 Tax=Nephila pilipes TaxID=299642 RepID=A0A8X6PP68_NEPPI|nr:hypothetical protein NPIL_189971 [Nephila pilipes]